jgi:outer membrane protein assembly factor BamB
MKNILVILAFLALVSCSDDSWNSKKGEIKKSSKDGIELELTDYGEINADKTNLTKIVIPEEKFYKNRYNQEQSVNSNFKLSGEAEDIKATTYAIGKQGQDAFVLGSVPIIRGNSIFLIDGGGVLSSRNLENPKQIFWEAPLTDKKEDFIGAKVIFDYSVVYVTLKTGKVMALSASTGDVLWEKSGFTYINSAPIILNDLLIIATLGSETIALNISNGETVWKHKGTEESSTKFKSAAPVAYGNNLVASYSSGEVFLLDGKTGKEKWVAQSYSNLGIDKVAQKTTSISITPIIDDGKVYVFGDNGVMLKLNAQNGEVVFRKDIDVTERPAIIGNHIYAIHRGKYLVAFDKFRGKNNWVLNLPEIQPKKAYFSGPIMAGSELILVNSDGVLHIIDPKTGDQLEKIIVPKKIFLPPVYTAGKVYLFSNNAELVVLE